MKKNLSKKDVELLKKYGMAGAYFSAFMLDGIKKGKTPSLTKQKNLIKKLKSED